MPQVEKSALSRGFEFEKAMIEQLRRLRDRINRVLAAIAVSIEMNTEAMKVERVLKRAPLSHRVKRAYHRGQKGARAQAQKRAALINHSSERENNVNGRKRSAR